MKHRYLLGAGLALAVTLSWANAQAQFFAMPTGPGAFYFGPEGGWTNLENQTGRVAGFPITERFNDGFNAGFRAGYEWGPWRLEEEYNYRRNDLSTLSIAGVGIPVTGGRTAHALMTNLIYDFTFGWPFTPHLGVGLGAVELRDAISVKTLGPIFKPCTFSCTLAASTDWEFGYQAIAGIRYNINPALAFDLDYRYLATTDPTFRAVTGTRYTSGYSTHNLVASLTLRFGAPPAAAPPVAPPPPVVSRRVFLVFFDWDKDTITPEGMAVVQQAAQAFQSGAPVTIQVTGYTDLSGSAGYNQRLSERRANNVANALVRFGVPRQAMVVTGRGMNDPRVPTAPGVREPQNRRVEIVFP